MPILCSTCSTNSAVFKQPKTGQAICKECFFNAFEAEVHQTICTNNLFERGELIAIGASGGKDSTVLAYVLKVLNERHNYGLDLVLLSVDEGITGYRDDSLETVKRNQQKYELPLKIVSYEELYGWTAIVQKIGLKNNCTFCGVFRRQALDRGALLLKVDKIVTGHNADDIAETVLMNILRGDIARLGDVLLSPQEQRAPFQGVSHSNTPMRKRLLCMHISRSLITFQQSAYTLQMPIGGMQEHF